MNESLWVPAMAFIQRHEPTMLELLQAITLMESPSSDTEAVSRLAAHLAAWCESHGLQAQPMPLPGAGDMLTVTCGGDTALRPAAFIAHMDTVHPRGSWPCLFRREGDELHGPGVFDCKGGIVIALFAALALREAGCTRPIRILLASDEEVAHALSRGHGGVCIAEQAAGCGAVFTCESGSLKPEAVVRRCGGAIVAITVTGRAAHAGRNPQDGASAIRSAARIIEAVESLNGTSDTMFNCGTVHGGSGANVIPDACSLSLGLRFTTNADFARAMEQLEAICRGAVLPGTSATAAVKAQYPAMEELAGTQELFDIYAAASARLDLPAPAAVASGGCSDTAFATRAGIPSLCALGMRGANAHALTEYGLASSLVPQCQRLAGAVLMLEGTRFS